MQYPVNRYELSNFPPYTFKLMFKVLEQMYLEYAARLGATLYIHFDMSTNL